MNKNQSDQKYHVVRTLDALANERRLKIVIELMAQEISVNVLALRVGLGQSALSQHLRILREAGLVKTRKVAQTVFYRACRDSLEMACKDLTTILTDRKIV